MNLHSVRVTIDNKSLYSENTALGNVTFTTTSSAYDIPIICKTVLQGLGINYSSVDEFYFMPTFVEQTTNGDVLASHLSSTVKNLHFSTRRSDEFHSPLQPLNMTIGWPRTKNYTRYTCVNICSDSYINVRIGFQLRLRFNRMHIINSVHIEGNGCLYGKMINKKNKIRTINVPTIYYGHVPLLKAS